MSATRWQQIVETFRAGIEAGQWRHGDRLPSETELARQWGVSRITAHRAMNELLRLGLVERRRRSGTIVSSRKKRHTGCVALLLHHSHDSLEMAYTEVGPPPDVQRRIQMGTGSPTAPPVSTR